jgi:hypothetical protein
VEALVVIQFESVIIPYSYQTAEGQVKKNNILD